MDSSNGTGQTGSNEFNSSNPNINPLNGNINPQMLQQLQQPQQQPQFQLSIPPNFDLNSIPPADREIFLNRLQLQQQQQFQLEQQQQQQLHRARQAQVQAQNFQKMTMNAYSTPRPPLNPSQQQLPPNSTTPIPTQTFFVNPMMNMSMPPMPMSMPMGYHQNFPINRHMPQSQNSINPALLQSGGTIKPSPPVINNTMQQMTQINPQQFTNPLKSDPVLYSMNTVNPAINPTTTTLNMPPFDDQVMSSEGSFIEHLIKFYDCVKFTNRVVPQIAQKPISLFRLFQVVISAGGFIAVGEGKKWALVAQALKLPANSYEVVSMIRATYYTFLYTYEQYFIQKKPLDKIDWPSQAKQQPQVSMQQPRPTAQQHQVPPQSQTPTPIPQMPPAFNAQALKLIPENELSLWKPFADVMKVPIGPISDLDTAILYLNSPYLTLKIEALLATQKLFAQATPKELQSAGVSSDSLSSLLEALDSIWSTENLNRRKESYKTMEDFWSETDSQKRDLLADRSDLSTNLMLCRQIVSLIRTLTVTKGSDVGQFLSRSDFIKQKILLFGLMESDDMELYKDSLIIYESISPHLGNIDTKLLKWTLKQCENELKQVRRERLTGSAVKIVGTLNLDRISSVENISSAKQAVTFLISQCAQLWKSVPAHIFLHLSASLSVLTSCDSIDFELNSFCKEIEEFMEMFLFPTVALLRALRTLLENTLLFAVEELRRILETVVYSPAFNLTDGGFLELCLQILCKCQRHQSDCLAVINWTGIYVLVRELREFWRHSECQQHVPLLAKICYQSPLMTAGTSPAKKTTTQATQNQKLELAIINGTSSLSSFCSHPFALLLKSLHLLVTNFELLPEMQKCELLQLAIEWNLGIPSQWGREVLGCSRIEEEIKILREFYF